MHGKRRHSRNTTTHQVDPATTLIRSDWYALRLLNYLRLFLLIAFAATFYLAEGFGVLGSRLPSLFMYCHLIWLFIALGFNSLIKLRRPGLETQFYTQSYIDIMMITLLTYASGGVDSGLGILLVMHIAIIANYARQRFTLLFAAIASTMLLSQELFASAAIGESVANLVKTSILGSTLFVVAVVTSQVLRRYPVSQAEPIERGLSLRQVGELNEQIISAMHSGILYIDKNDQVQVVNESASSMLSTYGLKLPSHLGLLSEPLYEALRRWRKNPASANRALAHKSLPDVLLTQFTGLSDGSTLVKLDDHQAIKNQLQQLKLASLGRLTTSIAHEIRNPLGAISNAVQLLQESDNPNAEDRRLMEITHRHTQRINRIIEDVMQLSTRKQANADSFDLGEQLETFRQRFLQQGEWADNVIRTAVVETLFAEFDLHHLDQILWNLCNNALDHNEPTGLEITLHAYRSDESALIIEVCDNGTGIQEAKRDSVFEPFFTTLHSGTGLGLYIIRELCELNNARIDCVAVDVGACFRITLPQPKAMAA